MPTRGPIIITSTITIIITITIMPMCWRPMRIAGI